MFILIIQLLLSLH